MQIDLSTHSKIDPMTTSTVLRTLQGKGFVERKEHFPDTRAKVVVLTGTGMQIVKKAVKTVEDFDLDFFSVLNDQVGSFNKHLLKIVIENKN